MKASTQAIPSGDESPKEFKAVHELKDGENAQHLQIRSHHDNQHPTLIYLPGLHGDWTLIGGFRKALRGRVRFVEITYPRTLSWSLDDYAREIEEALARLGIDDGWLLGESYGSQVLWAMVKRKTFKAHGVVLAGGFVRHPMQWGVRLAERAAGEVSLKFIARFLFFYARVARFRFRRSPDLMADIQEFIRRRTELDKQAAKHRLHLIASHDFRPLARDPGLPVYSVTGLVDPVVPWPWTRNWLKKYCPALREYRIVPFADHNVLGTAPQKSADIIVDWINTA